MVVLLAVVVFGASEIPLPSSPDYPGRKAADEVEAIPPAEPEPLPVPALPRRAAAHDPWFTRATVSAQGGKSTLAAEIPVTGMNSRYEGAHQAGGLAIDLYGRRLGFNLAFAGGASRDATAPIDGVGGTRITTGEASASFTGVLWNSPGVFLAVGPSIEGRATAIGHFEEGNEAVASWQTVIAGGDARARVFAGPHVFFTGHVFAGALPVSGAWQSVDAAAAGGEVVSTGELTDAFVLSGSASVSFRPAEWVAVSGGVAARTATYTFEDRTGSENTIRPYLALELLY